MDHSTPTFPEKTYPDVLTPCEKRQFRDLLSHFQGKRSMIQHLRMTTVVLRVDLEEKRQGEDIRRTSTIAHPKAPNLTVVFVLMRPRRHFETWGIGERVGSIERRQATLVLSASHRADSSSHHPHLQPAALVGRKQG